MPGNRKQKKQTWYQIKVLFKTTNVMEQPQQHAEHYPPSVTSYVCSDPYRANSLPPVIKGRRNQHKE